MKTKTTTLWLRSTSRYHPYECFILCRTALESIQRSLTPSETLHPAIVKLTNSSHAYCGRASWGEWEHHGPATHRKATYWRRVLVRVGKPSHFPCKVQYIKFKDMPEAEFRTYREAIVGITAHELGHAIGKGGRKDGELACEMMLSDALDYYRDYQDEIDAEIERALDKVRQRELSAVVAERPEAKAAAKLAAAERKLKHWKRKLTIATNKVKKYTRLMRRLSAPDLKIVPPPAQPEALAATPPQP